MSSGGNLFPILAASFCVEEHSVVMTLTGSYPTPGLTPGEMGYSQTGKFGRAPGYEWPSSSFALYWSVFLPRTHGHTCSPPGSKLRVRFVGDLEEAGWFSLADQEFRTKKFLHMKMNAPT